MQSTRLWTVAFGRLTTSARLTGGGAPVRHRVLHLAQHHGEGRAFARSRGDGEFALMPIQDVLNDGEAETGAPLFAARGDIDPVEALGQARQMLGQDAGPLVDHGNGVAAGLAAERGDMLRLDTHLAAPIAIFEGVLHQVLEY